MITTNVNGTYREIDEVWARVGNSYKEIIKVWDSSDSKWVYEAVGTVTGTLPLTAHTDGSDTVDYIIYGDSVQADTPTPSDPVEVVGVGVRTENLYNMNATDASNGYLDGYYISKSNGSFVTDSNYELSEYIKVIENTRYYWLFGGGARHSRPTIEFLTSDKERISVAQHADSIYGFGFTTPTNCEYIRISVYKNVKSQSMLTEDSTASYIPYGYKLPMVSRTENFAQGTDKGITVDDTTGEPIPATSASLKYWCLSTTFKVNIGDRVWTWVSDYIGGMWWKYVIINGGTVVQNGSGYSNKSSVSINATGDMRVVIYVSNANEAAMNNAINSLIISKFTPTTYIPYRNTETPIYIGDEPLYEDEYVDFSEQKVYKYVDGVLTPIDPPVPLPALPTFGDADTIFDYEETPAPSGAEIKYKKGW